MGRAGSTPALSHFYKPKFIFKKMAKIKTITVSNLKAVSNMTADFNGCTAIVTGGNNKGKTSFLRGLMDRLRGVKPDIIVKQGEKEMNSELELTTGEKFIWQINENGNEKLLIERPDFDGGEITYEILGGK